jgi:hypothetical protein
MASLLMINFLGRPLEDKVAEADVYHKEDRHDVKGEEKSDKKSEEESEERDSSK